MKILTIISLAFAALAGVQTVNAATFDFVSEAAGNERGVSTLILSDGGITLNATGQQTLANGDTDTAKTAFVYLDDLSGGRPAGLGVCKALSGTQCTDSGDDNVTLDEKLTLDFGQLVTISEITMRNGTHRTSFDGKFKLNIDGAGWVAYDLDDTITQLFTGQVFELWNNNTSVAADKEFYISTMTVSAVPIPAAIWLFGSAMLGFVGIRRNNKKPA